MVLQRAPQSARLWGSTNAPNTKVSLLLGTTPSSTTSDSNGNWSISLMPQNTTFNTNIMVEADNITIKLMNVAFGDVYLCGGADYELNI